MKTSREEVAGNLKGEALGLLQIETLDLRGDAGSIVVVAEVPAVVAPAASATRAAPLATSR
jgi:hypothetical protein